MSTVPLSTAGMIRQQPNAAKVNIDMDSTGSAGALSTSRRGEYLARASRDALEAAGKRSFSKLSRQILEERAFKP